MSWLGGSFSSLTGQLSNLTKDILTEGTEEVSDHVTELRLAQEKIKELDTVCVGQKIEIDRLKLLNRECEEKAEGSELQINRISTEYRSLLEEKEKEVKALKHEIQESSTSYVSPESQPAVLRLDSENGFESVGYGTDEHDFSDSISMQHDINRLRSDVRQLQSECQHWKSLVQNQSFSEDGGLFENKEKESQLGKQIQNLQQQLAQEKDTRQHELSALQDAQTHKISQMRKKHKEEVSELKAKLQELEWGSEGWETQMPEETASLKATINSLKEEISVLQSERESHLNQITSLSESVDEFQSELAVKQAHSLHLENQLKVAKEALQQVEEDRDQADTLEVLSDLRDVRQHLDMTAIERRNKLLLEKDKLINQMITSSEKKKELSCAVENLTELNESLQSETKAMVKELGDTEQQKLTAGIVDSLEKETLMLREQNVGLQEQVTLLEKALQNANTERLANKLSVSAESDVPVGEELVMVSDSASMTSDFSEISRRNLELDDVVKTLKAQISNYETEINQFEMMQSDWLSEKETLEGVLLELRSQLKVKENSLNVAEAKRASLQQEITDLRTRLHSNQSDVFAHKQQTDKGKQHNSSSLNGQLKEKEKELQALISEKEDMEKSIAEVPELKLQLQQKEEEMEYLVNSQKEEIRNLEKEVEELKKKLRGKNEEIVNLTLEKEEMMTSLEELDNQHQEAVNHIIQIKEQLAKSNEDLKAKCASLETEKQSIETEYEKLKNHHIMNQSAESSSSNELNHQIAELKDEIAVLKQKLDHSTSTVNKLEQECKTNDVQLSEMKDKLAASAEALNNLHMDKQELQDKVAKYKKEMSSQAEKLKTAREENRKLKQEISSSGVNNSTEKELVQTKDQDLSRTEINRLESEIDMLNADLETSQFQLKEKSEDCEKLQSHLKKAEQMLDEFNKSVECKDMEVVDLRTKIASAEVGGVQSEEKLNSALQDCERLKKESDRKHEECESFSRHLHAMENELQSMKSTLSEKNTEISTLSSQHEILNAQVTDLKQNLQTKEVECESLKKELPKVKDLLEDTADKLHNKCEECQLLTEKIEKLKSEVEDSVNYVKNDYEAQLLSATGELVLVKEELAHKTEEWDRLDKALYCKDEHIGNLNEEKCAILKEMEHLKSEFDQIKESSETNFKEMLETQKQNETLTGENNRLKNELDSLGQKFSDQKQHYESYLNELKSVKESDSNSQQTEYNDLLEKAHKKDLQISENEAKLNNLYAQLQDCQRELETIGEKHQSLQHDCDRYIQEITELHKSVQTLNTENTTLSESVKQQELMLEELQEQYDAVKTEKDSLESEVQVYSLENSKLLEESKNEKDKLNAQLKELEAEVTSCKQKENTKHNETELLTKENISLTEKNENLQSELHRNKQLIKDNESRITELNQKVDELSKEWQKESETATSQDGMIKVLKDNCVQKDNDISMVQRKLSYAISFLNEEHLKLMEHNESNLKSQHNSLVENGENAKIHNTEVEEKISKVETKQIPGMQIPDGDIDLEHATHTQDVIMEIERLQGQLKEKDSVIFELQRNSASLLKLLDTKSKSQGDSPLVELHKLENEVRALKTEKEQMMDVLTEKSRENSNSKAEVQRLMNVVAAEKAALQKLQKDNQELMAKSQEHGSAHIDDMQKETVKTLSRLIRDKDLEIESLTQKNETLLSVLQESSTEGSQINALMADKEILTKNLATLQGEREQMIAYLNQKHQESVSYHAEVQRLTAVVNSESEKYEKLKHDYAVVVPQYEDKKQSLVKAQNELINYKQKYQELEVKTGRMIQQSESGETVDKTLYDAKLHEHSKLQERYQELIESVKEKEAKIQNMYQQVSDMEQNFRTCDSEKTSYKKQVDSFMFQIHGLQTEQGDLKAEITQLKQQRDSVASECQQLKETNNKLTLQVQDRDFEVSSLQEKMRSLTQMIQDQQGEKGQLEHVMQENESTQKHIKQLTLERDQALGKLQETREQNSQLLNDIQSLKERESKLNRELDRLRQHLIQIEEGYTKEALAAEEREKDLRTRLTAAEENALSSTSAAESANQQAGHQLDSLQQQLHFVSQQRDQAYLQISSLQEQNQMYSSSIANLQMVLEEFQQEKERLVSEETERYVKEVKRLREQVGKLSSDLRYTKEQLDEASDGLEAASRLSEQLDRKEEALDALREEVQIRESALKHAEDELRSLRSRNDDRVDKLVIKNLFLGYFSAPQNQRHEVLRTIGGVLLFTSDDFEKIEGKHTGGGGWVPGFLKFSGGQKQTSPPTTPVRRSTIGAAPARAVDNSFSQMFVKFLERESSPPPPTVRLPAEEMVRDVQKHKETQKPAYNPFTAPRHVAMPTSNTPHTGPHTSQHLLMSSTASVSQTLPTFAAPSESSNTPPGSGRNTPATTTSGAILKDVLNR